MYTTLFLAKALVPYDTGSGTISSYSRIDSESSVEEKAYAFYHYKRALGYIELDIKSNLSQSERSLHFRSIYRK